VTAKGNSKEKRLARERAVRDGIPYVMALRLVRQEWAETQAKREEEKLA
jgi:hypothetical protein